MGFLNFTGNLGRGLKKYKAVAAVILAGILLMSLPDRKEKLPALPPPKEERDLEQQLQELLSRIEGAGNVELLLSEATGEQFLYQYNEDKEGNDGGFRRETVIIADRDRREQGLIRQVNAPRYRGAVVIAQGGDRPRVVLSIKKAVSSAAGLGTDKITVLKMK